MFAEQMNPFTGAPLSVAPLTWSHAVYIDTLLQYTAKRHEIVRRRERTLRSENPNAKPANPNMN
jgi:hypothetical protein